MKREILHQENGLGGIYHKIIDQIEYEVERGNNFKNIQEEVIHLINCHNNGEVEFNQVGLTITDNYIPMVLSIFPDENQIRVATHEEHDDDFYVIRVY